MASKKVATQNPALLEVAEALLEGVTEPNKQAFILAFSQCGSRRRAGEAVGITRVTVWHWLQKDPQFVKAFERAQEIAGDVLEDEMMRRAVEGVMEPVYQGGKLVGSVRRYSDTLLIFGLKGAKPKKYRENIKIEHGGSVDLVGRLQAARERALGRKND